MDEQREIRIKKLDILREKGINPYIEKFVKSHDLKDLATLPDNTENVHVAGRIIAIRQMGKVTFVNIQDIEG